MVAKKRPQVPIVREVKWRTVQIFTFIQLACTFCIFAVANFAEAGYIYPALLVILVPIRFFILSKCFSDDDMEHLDPHAEEEYDKDHYMDEQMLIHRQRNDSIDPENIEFTNWANFRGQGKVHSGRHNENSDFTDDSSIGEVKLNTVEKASNTIVPEVVKT